MQCVPVTLLAVILCLSAENCVSARSQDDMLVTEFRRWLKEKVPGLETDFKNENMFAEKLVEVLVFMKSNESINQWLLQEEERFKATNNVATEIYNLKRVARNVKSNSIPTLPVLIPRFHCDINEKHHSRRKMNTMISPPISIPRTVHELHPSDIRVVAAMGDSLTSGTGILANNIFGILVQDHGHAFSIGGFESYESQSTLPNILKKWNANLKGHSIGQGVFYNRANFLNVAAPGSKSKEMLDQAVLLVERMRQMKDNDYNNDWKVITIFVGANDLCDYCFNPELYSPAQYKRHLSEAIDYLYAEVPKVFINLLEVVDISLAYYLQNGGKICKLLQSVFMCRCATNVESPEELEEVRDYVRRYQKVVREIANDPYYEGRSDFTVVSQPLFRNATLPKLSDGSFDGSFLAPDCFHFNRRGHMLAGLALWRNMLEPLNSKTDDLFRNPKLDCPLEAQPFLATKVNSRLKN